MTNRQKKRSEETKRAILTAAGELFSLKGYHSVTMREIAKEAGCSHTTIYIYFKDKEELLHELTMPSLVKLKKHFQTISSSSDKTAEMRLKEMSLEFVRFCLRNKTMYSILFIEEATRVDETAPKLAVNKLRIQLFDLIKHELSLSLQLLDNDDLLLMYGRIYIFMLNGIVTTYKDSRESFEDLMSRLDDTFETAFEVLLRGFNVSL